MERVPQVLENVTPARAPAARADGAARRGHRRRSKQELGDDGRVLVRWSGTEPKLRIMLEGPDEARIAAWAQDLIAAARADIPA